MGMEMEVGGIQSTEVLRRRGRTYLNRETLAGETSVSLGGRGQVLSQAKPQLAVVGAENCLDCGGLKMFQLRTWQPHSPQVLPLMVD